jgi:hypothetical protein
MKAAALLAAAVLLPAIALAQNVSAFAPGGPTVTLAATAASARVQVQPSANNKSIRVFNGGTVPVFLACGDVAIVATVAAGMPIAPGTVEIIGCTVTHIAGIAASGTASVYLTPGNGM